MMTLVLGDQTWMDAWGRTILQDRIRSDAFLRARFAREIALVDASGRSAAAVGAMSWLSKTQAFLDYREKNWPVLGVSYEELACRPEAVLGEVLKFLDVPWNDAVLNHPAFAHEEVFPHGLTVGETDPSRSIDGRSVGRWRAVLSPREEELIMKIAGPLNERVVESCTEACADQLSSC
jgi:hypothetical protein